jgi:hypothetical protein
MRLLGAGGPAWDAVGRQWEWSALGPGEEDSVHSRLGQCLVVPSNSEHFLHFQML